MHVTVQEERLRTSVRLRGGWFNVRCSSRARDTRSTTLPTPTAFAASRRSGTSACWCASPATQRSSGRPAAGRTCWPCTTARSWRWLAAGTYESDSTSPAAHTPSFWRSALIGSVNRKASGSPSKVIHSLFISLFSDKESMFSRRLSVCLSVSNSNFTPELRRIIMKILPEIYLWTKKSPWRFWSHTDQDPDQGIFEGIFITVG